MGIQLRNKAFTLLDCLLILIIISMLSVFSISRFKKLDFLDKYFICDYLYLQVDSLCNKKNNYLTNIYSKYPIYFNEKGNVNMAQTVIINNHKIKIYLGNGCLSYE